MRGIGYTLSRLPTARALLAGAAILAGAFTSAAHGQMSGLGNGKGTPTPDDLRPDEAAWGSPRLPLADTPGVALPQPLRPVDAALMRQIFAFQAHGDITSAVRFSGDLSDPLLLGTILAERYLGLYHRSTTAELADWLSRYGDHPDAPAIHTLLLSRLPKGTAPPVPPETVAAVLTAEPDPMPEDIDPPRNDLVRDPALDRIVLDGAQRGNTSAALRAITTARGLSPAYASQLRSEVAQVLFTHNEDAAALLLAQLALRAVSTADQPPLGFYIGGLAAWRLDRIDLARALFESGAKAPNTSARLHAASAFWASRASRRIHDAVSTVSWLRAAAEERLTVHGLLARRILHMDTGVLPPGELLAQADVDAVAATPQGWRALALLQVGRSDQAEAELRALWSKAPANPVFGRSVMLVTAAIGHTDRAAQMAAWLQSQDASPRGEPRFPVPRLRPAGGFTIDPTLVYALTKVESNFNTKAISPAGARGLMQIMPATAQFITGNRFYSPTRLHDPVANLDIGQRYIAHLARLDGIDNDLLRILASYNAGPGNFGRWGADLHDRGDPLLFIEAIPVTETRTFVQHTLVYSWVYAARMHLPATSLDALAAGEFPRLPSPQLPRPRVTPPRFTPPRFTQAERERTMALLSPEPD